MSVEENIKVSVIIPAYNASVFIEETVQSVLNQSFTNWELLIIDDGSTDDTLDIVKSLSKKDLHIRVMGQENGGVSSARNLGISHASGHYLAFLDADDIWEPNFLLKCLHKFSENYDWGLVHCDLQVINEHSEKTGEYQEGLEGSLIKDILSWHRHIISPPSGILVKRSTIDKIGGFDTNLSNNADQDFYIRVAHSFSIGRISEYLLRYRIHPANMHKNIKVQEKDWIFVHHKARRALMFESSAFQKACLANIYLVLGANYWGHKRRLDKLIFYLLRAVFIHPPSMLIIVKKILKRK